MHLSKEGGVNVHGIMREILQDSQQCIHLFDALAQDKRTGRKSKKETSVVALTLACSKV